MTGRSFDLWVAGDAHVGTDLAHGRESLAEALRQSEGAVTGFPAFSWDLLLDVGDLSGDWAPPGDAEGEEVVRQYKVMTQHRREQVYHLAGNHDASTSGGPAENWFRRYADPLGEFPALSGVQRQRRPYAIEGTWERYRFDVGNVRFLVMSDRNDGPRPRGRGSFGGNPGGAVTAETFDWWVDQVESNRDKILITAHHYVLKETTVASGPWEGFRDKDRYGRRTPLYHGYFPDGAPMGAGYLYWVDGNPDAEAFERYLADHPGCVDLWLAGHSHVPAGHVRNGRSHIERKWGVTFVNCAALTRHHATAGMEYFPAMSRVFGFQEGRSSVKVRCYLHTQDLGPGGWHEPEERWITLSHPFRPDGGPPEVRPSDHHQGPRRPADAGHATTDKED
jgi:hypothetical protein